MQFENRQDIDSVKGVLIFLVVLGHSILANEYTDVQTFVYSFHVYAFLLLPFILSKKVITWENLLNTATRYLIPYLLLVFLASIPNAWMKGYSIHQWAWFYFRGVVTANDNYLKATSGFYLLWFLPVIFWVNILLQIYNRLGAGGKTSLTILFCVAHLLLPAMSWEQKKYFSCFGLHIACYIMPIGLFLRIICSKMGVVYCRKSRYIWLAGFLILIAAMFGRGSALTLAHLGCPSYQSPLNLIIHGLIPIFAVLALIGFSKGLCRFQFLVSAGQRSIYVYLFSQPAVIGVHIFYRATYGFDSQLDIILCGIASIISGMCLGFVVACSIERLSTVRALLFPRSFMEFSGVVQPLKTTNKCDKA